MPDKNWYIICSAGSPHSLINIQDAFNKADTKVTLWVPTIKQKVIEDGQTILKDRKMFYNYIFVCCDLSQSSVDQYLSDLKVGWLLKAPGMTSPCKILEEDIQSIRVKEAMMSEGKIETPFISIGDYVEIRSGVFIGFKGQVVAIKNQKVSIETFVFGRTNTVEVSLDRIIKMDLSIIYPVREEGDEKIKEIGG